MSTKIETRFLNRSEYGLWNSFVAKSSYGSIYSTSEYLDILCGVTNGNFKILVAKQGDEIIGGVGLYERQLLGRKLVDQIKGLIRNNPFL